MVFIWFAYHPLDNAGTFISGVLYKALHRLEHTLDPKKAILQGFCSQPRCKMVIFSCNFNQNILNIAHECHTWMESCVSQLDFSTKILGKDIFRKALGQSLVLNLKLPHIVVKKTLKTKDGTFSIHIKLYLIFLIDNW